jgi:hypothetical protein
MNNIKCKCNKNSGKPKLRIIFRKISGITVNNFKKMLTFAETNVLNKCLTTITILTSSVK